MQSSFAEWKKLLYKKRSRDLMSEAVDQVREEEGKKIDELIAEHEMFVAALHQDHAGKLGEHGENLDKEWQDKLKVVG